MMEFNSFLAKLISRCREKALKKLTRPHDIQGALAGLMACEGKNINELKVLLKRTQRVCDKARSSTVSRYYRVRNFQIQVEAVCGAVSIWLIESGKRSEIIMRPTMSSHTAFALVMADHAKN